MSTAVREPNQLFAALVSWQVSACQAGVSSSGTNPKEPDQWNLTNRPAYRGRPAENKWIGQRLDDPPPDIAAMARAQGVEARGPLDTLSDFETTLVEGIASVQAGRPFLLDVIVRAECVGQLENGKIVC